MKIKLFYIIAILLFAVSCEEKNIQQTLVLNTPQQSDNSITLTWEQSEVPGFQYYMVMCASDGQNFTIINDVVNSTSDAFHKDITTFTDNTYPLEADTLYYKVMAVGNKTVSSKNVLFRNENKATVLRGQQIVDMYYLEEVNKMSVLAYSNAGCKLRSFDMQSGQFLQSEANVYISSSCSWLMWGHYNGKTEAYNYPSNNTIVCYDAATAQQTAVISVPDVCYDPYATNDKGMIYVYSYYLYCINRATGTYTRYQPVNQIYYYDSYLYYNSRDNKLYAIDEYNSSRNITFNLNDDGSVANDESFTINNSSTPVYIKNSSLFIVNTDGQYKILDMNTKMYYSIDLASVSFYASNSKAIFANNNIYLSDGRNRIFQISTNDYKITKTYTTRTNPQQMFVANGYLYYFGQYDYNAYLLDKIKL